MDENEKLIVKKIGDGTVIDHIARGKGLTVMKILKINSDLECYLIQNVESKKLGRKDIVKIVGKYFPKDEMDNISLFSPTATVNYIKNRSINEKYKVKTPYVVKDLIKCPNRFCITNMESDVKTRFDVLQDGRLLLQCSYCDGLLEGKNIEKYFI